MGYWFLVETMQLNWRAAINKKEKIIKDAKHYTM